MILDEVFIIQCDPSCDKLKGPNYIQRSPHFRVIGCIIILKLLLVIGSTVY